MLHSPALDLHIRTTIASYYSYIESAALRIGNTTTVEVHPRYLWVNNNDNTGGDEKIAWDQLPHIISTGNGDTFTIFKEEEEPALGTTTSHSKNNNNNKVTYLLQWNSRSYLKFRFYQHFLNIDIVGHLADFGGKSSSSTGLLGDFESGAWLGRDGREMTSSADDFGFEWQVNPAAGDVPIFRHARQPQLPYEKCRLPTASRPSRRRRQLRGDSDLVLFTQAEQACRRRHHHAPLDQVDFDLCVHDVVATGDVGMATLW